MWIRFKRWTFATILSPHVEHCQSGRTYLWDGSHAGAVDVPYKADIDQILNPVGDRQSDYEVAYEQYGIRFDGQGKEVQEVVPSTPPDTTPRRAKK